MSKKIRSWLSICSSSSTYISTADDNVPHRETTSSGTITINEVATSSSTSSSPNSSDQDNYSSTSTSLESNLSILTLPSVPSLQNLHLSPENFINTHLSAVVSVTTSLVIKPPPSRPCRSTFHVINFLSVHDNLIYAVSGQEIIVFDDIINNNSTPFDTFSVKDSSSSSSSGSVKSLAFCNGKIFSAHQDSKIRVWKLIIPDKKHKLVATLPKLEDCLRNFILPKNYVRVRRHRKKLWIDHYDAVSGLAVAQNNDSANMYSVSWDKYFKVWKAPEFRCVESVKAHDDAINAVVVSPEGLIYTGSADKRIKVWERRPVGDDENKKKKKHVLIATLEKHKSAVNALALSSDGTVLFSGSCDRSILVWEKEDSANHMVLAGALRGHSKAVLCLINVVYGGGSRGSGSDDRDLLFSGSADGTVRVWQRRRLVMDRRYCCLTVLDGHNRPVKSLAAVPPVNGECESGDITVLSGSFGGEIKVWKITVSSTIKKP